MTTISQGKHHLRVSHLGEPNPLPIFRWQQPTKFQPAPPSPDLSEEEVRGAFLWGEASILPYQVQDSYDRAQEEGALDAIFIENTRMKLRLYPTLGGRLASIWYKDEERELLFDNPVFQPANLAALNAWFSGGIEWNGLIPGHTPFTCSPVFVAKVTTERGPIVRLYEFDRIREAAWQVDLFLPEDECRIWIHVTLTNPNPYAVDCYWWTNMAAPLNEHTRVLSPADCSIEHVLPDNHLAPFDFPLGHGYDGSYPVNYRDSASVFFRRHELQKPWIASFGEDGRGIYHAATDNLNGRKLFTWGSNAGGQRWQQYLSCEGHGEYIELQAGVAPTQNQEFVLGAGEVLSWTECIAPVSIEPEVGHDSDFHAACAAMAEIGNTIAPADGLQEMDEWLSETAVSPVDTVLQRGRAWGMLHERLTGKTISPGLDFAAEVGDEYCWADLLAHGHFSSNTLNRPPASWAVSKRWKAHLEGSMEARGTTWLHELFSGVIELDQEDVDNAYERFMRSAELKNNYLAHRHLALIHEQRDNLDEAWREYMLAWKTANDNVNLAVEMCQFLQRHTILTELTEFVSALPDVLRKHERIRLALAQVALLQGRYDLVREILYGEFATNREGETLLSDLWIASFEDEAAEQKGAPLTDQEKSALRQAHPVPNHIDFRMKTEINDGE